MRSKDVSPLTPPASPHASSAQTTLVHEGAEKASIHDGAHERRRISIAQRHRLTALPYLRDFLSPHSSLCSQTQRYSKNAPSISTGFAAPCSCVLPGMAVPPEFKRMSDLPGPARMGAITRGVSPELQN